MFTTGDLRTYLLDHTRSFELNTKYAVDTELVGVVRKDSDTLNALAFRFSC